MRKCVKITHTPVPCVVIAGCTKGLFIFRRFVNFNLGGHLLEYKVDKNKRRKVTS